MDSLCLILAAPCKREREIDSEKKFNDENSIRAGRSSRNSCPSRSGSLLSLNLSCVILDFHHEQVANSLFITHYIMYFLPPDNLPLKSVQDLLFMEFFGMHFKPLYLIDSIFLL